MHVFRIRFSVRSLVVAIAVVAVIVELSVRFGPHFIWRTFYADIALGVEPIPSKPLIDVAPDEEVVKCVVGPLSFEMPQSMSGSFVVHRGIGGAFIKLYDSERSILLELPKPEDRWLQEGLREFPDKAKLSFPQLEKEIADAKSSDFSYAMSRKELKWHQWLLTKRAVTKGLSASNEYMWRHDLEGVLSTMRSMYSFQWVTSDGQWEGMLHFKSASPSVADWVRHTCATFICNGDPGVFQGASDESIQALIEFIPPSE